MVHRDTPKYWKMAPKKLLDCFGYFQFTWLDSDDIPANTSNYSNLRQAIKRFVVSKEPTGEKLLHFLNMKDIGGIWAIQWINQIIHWPTGATVYQSGSTQVSISHYIYIFYNFRYVYCHNTTTAFCLPCTHATTGAANC